MTATQVFLRFVKNEYTNGDGTINVRKFSAWRTELRKNCISSKPVTDNNCRIIYPVRYRRLSKNFVDDFLYRNRATLNGFVRNFFFMRSNYYFYVVYGFTVNGVRESLIKRWKKFLSDNIVESDDFAKYWTKNRNFNFTWKG